MFLQHRDLVFQTTSCLSFLSFSLAVEGKLVYFFAGYIVHLLQVLGGLSHSDLFVDDRDGRMIVLPGVGVLHRVVVADADHEEEGDGGGEGVVVVTGDHVAGLDPASGDVYWKHPFAPARMVIRTSHGETIDRPRIGRPPSSPLRSRDAA